MTENTNIVKWLPGKDQIQGASRKTWSTDETEAAELVTSYCND